VIATVTVSYMTLITRQEQITSTQ